jgi:MFS family permease
MDGSEEGARESGDSPGVGVGPERADASAVRSPAGLKRIFASLGDRTFRWLWIGMLLQAGAMQINMMAQGYFVYELTGSAARLGIVATGMAVGAPLVLFGGVLADRVEKKRLIQFGQIASMMTTLFVAISITTGIITWQFLLAASVLQGFTLPFMMPARQSIIPQLVPRERLMNAIALNSMAMGATTMIAPAVAGVLIATVGIEWLYYIITGLYGIAILFTSLLPKVPPRPRAQDSNVLKELGAGLGYVRSNKVIMVLLVLGFSQIMLLMPFRNILPVFAKDVFLVGPEGLGIMMTFMGVGSLGGALFVASLKQVGRRGLMLMVSGVVSGLIVVGFSTMSEFIPIFGAALVFMALMGMLQAGRMTMQNSLTMEYTQDEYRGRVISINMIGFSLMPMGVLPLSIGAELVGAPIALAIMGTVFILISIGVLVGSGRLRRLA